MNKVMVTGRFATDPKIGTTPSGTAFANFDFAVTTLAKKTNSEEFETMYYHVSVFGKSAGYVAKFGKKGVQATIMGNFTVREYMWKDQQGNQVPRRSYDVNANDINIYMPPKENNGFNNYQAPVTQAPPQEHFVEVEEDELPF